MSLLFKPQTCMYVEVRGDLVVDLSKWLGFHPIWRQILSVIETHEVPLELINTKDPKAKFRVPVNTLEMNITENILIWAQLFKINDIVS